MDKGAFYEKKAEDYLKVKGYRILKKNFRTPYGEIDIIGKDKGVVAFVEVKARDNNFRVSPQEAVDKFKQRRLIKTAKVYCSRHYSKDYRFDVLALLQGRDWRIYKLIKNAFSEDENL